MAEHPLIENIYKTLTESTKVPEESAKRFGEGLAAIITARVNESRDRGFTLRMSNLGKGARQLWYEKHFEPEEKLEGHTLLKFLIGDITESTLLFLAEVAGHKVTNTQDEVSLAGIKGHIDAEIDGVTVDVKSASAFAFKKFKNGTLSEDDPFGYIEQIAGYSKARDTAGAFLAMDKTTGHLAYLEYPKEELHVFDIEGRIGYLKEVLDKPEIPDRCYDDEKMGESGNRKLGTNCSYCPFKKRCWADANGGIGLRTFIYASGPVFLTEVKVEPKVYEKSF